MNTTKPRGKASVRRLIEERDRLLAEVAALQNQIAGLERAIALLGGEPRASSSSATTEGAKPPGAKALILELLREVGTTGLTIDSTIEVASKRGISLNRGTVASTYSRLKKEGAVAHDGQRYRLPEFMRPRPVIVGQAAMPSILGQAGKS